MESSMFSPVRLTVSWLLEMDGVGLKAARNTRSLPSLIPPQNASGMVGRLYHRAVCRHAVAVVIFRSLDLAAANPSLFQSPLRLRWKGWPWPGSRPAFSNTGSPNPAGSPDTTHSTTPPAEIRSAIRSSRYRAARSAASGSGIYKGFSAAVLSASAPGASGRRRSPQDRWSGCRRRQKYSGLLKIFSAMAPAATRPMVSPGGGPAAAPVIPEAKLLIEGIIRMTRPVAAGDLRIVPGALVPVPHDHGNGRSRGLSFKYAG